MIPLAHSYADAVPDLNLDWQAAGFPLPEVAVVDDALAVELGLDPAWLRTSDGVAWLLGRGQRTVAQAYAGHQFGGFSPRLGDGRALLLGETPDGRDLHLKGSGRTPFSRGGDGYAAIGPMLREHLMGTWVHALGIPTTRALAVITTGAVVMRERDLPGAVLVRVGASHLRVGTFQLAASNPQTLADLLAYAAHRHGYPTDALGFFRAVCTRQARLVAQWMAVGLVHGVMNTDNTTISGETIDYGPVAVMERYDPLACFSSIDHQGRYAYGNQPVVLQWNLARLAEALLALGGDVVDYQEALDDYADEYGRAHRELMAAKLGLRDVPEDLLADLYALLDVERPDWTTFWADLSRGEVPPAFAAWAMRWRAVGPDLALVAATNPLAVPRNHRVEEALAAATAGDLGPYERLLAAVARPFERPDLDVGPAPDDAEPHVTFCGT